MSLPSDSHDTPTPTPTSAPADATPPVETIVAADAKSSLRFEDLQLDPRILRAVEGLGFEHPTPIQAEAIPPLMEGRDMLGGARTGSGKTAAFGLPLLHRVRDANRTVRALVLTPTRELAIQVADAIDAFARHLPVKVLTVYGGVGYRQQLIGLKEGVQVIVGTPGRVLDHLSSGALDLSSLELLVLDEADEMLQMGFIDDIERVLQAAPEGRQIALFSATMPPAIKRIAERYLVNPARIQVESKGLTSSHVTQRWLKVGHRQKAEALARVLRAEQRDATLVFARTRANVAQLATELMQQGFSVDALHGDLNQGARELVLSRLRARQVEIVVATDVAARGLDVDHITHVINYDMPEGSETYVHRIGRTARAGRQGWAISLITPHEQPKLRQLQRDLGRRIDPMQLPTEAQIAARQRAALRQELDAAMDASGSELAEAWLTELLNDTGWSAPDVAAAALSLLAIERSFDLRAAIKPEPYVRPAFDERDDRSYDRPERSYDRPERSYDRPERQSSSPPEGGGGGGDTFSQVNEVELFFPVGRRDGYRPADFVGALCNGAGLSSSDIGRITLGGNKAFVGLAKSVAEELIASHGSIELRGQTYTLQLSFDSKDGAPPRAAQDDEGGGERGAQDKKSRFNKPFKGGAGAKTQDKKRSTGAAKFGASSTARFKKK